MENTDWMNHLEKTGTSLLAAEFSEGVVIGADSRTSMGTYISERSSDKLTVMTPYVCCARSGSSADTQAVAEAVLFRLELLKMEMGEPVPVKIVAQSFRQLCYDYRDSISAGIICAGWDKREGGQVYSIPLGGMIMRQKVSAGGSGSEFIYGHIDKTFKANMTREECAQFVSDALALAMGRDGSSGGMINLAIIDKNGIERRIVSGEKVPRFIDNVV